MRLVAGEALTRFTVSLPHNERFAEFFTGETVDEPMDYRFANGKGPAEASFCRRIFRRDVAQRAVSPDKALPASEATWTGHSDTVTFSGVQPVATHSQRWLRVTLHVPQTGRYPFEIATCGGVRIWSGDEQAVCFTPFTRNTLQTQAVDIPLQQGENALLIHLDELFERDTIFAFRMIYLGEHPLEAGLPTMDTAYVEALAQFMGSLPATATVRDQRLALTCPANMTLTLRGAVHSLGNDCIPTIPLDFGLVDTGNGELTLPLPASIGMGHYRLTLTASLGEVTMSRALSVTVLPQEALPGGEGVLETRKRVALSYIAEHGVPRTGRLLAMLHVGDTGSLAQNLLIRTLQRISARQDCSDFSMVPLLWIWHDFHGEHFPAVLWKRVRSAIVGYRYWYDELGNDVMWYWSENHALCFHTAQYLAGQMFPEERFIASGRTGREQEAVAAQRLNAWFDAIEQQGFVEWNSAPYYPVDYIGLFALYQLADDIALRQRAQRLIDRLMQTSALHYQSGIAAGTMGRVYEKELLAGQMTEISAFGHVAWGGGHVNRKCASLPFFCLSDYVPPLESARNAHLTHGTLSAHYQCGGGNIVAWKQPAVSLSSCVDHHSGERGHQQHLVDVQFAVRPDARLWVNHPGDVAPGSEARPSFWAGNGVLPRVMQVENQAMLLWQLDARDALGWTHLHLHAEAFDEVLPLAQGFAVRAGNAFAAVLCSQPLAVNGDEVRAEGRRVAWWLEVGEGDFSAFCQRVQALRIEHQDDVARVMNDQHMLMQLDGQGNCQHNGKAAAFPTLVGNEIQVTLSGDAQ
ncbi:hypothetical protein [Kluyvera sp. CHPC 1.251]|uniref:hypothetical protein n=1 Tax=Kluyvera sp. CHPC 1.251 TaxID=2995175 RepID=UPI002FD7D447